MALDSTVEAGATHMRRRYAWEVTIRTHREAVALLAKR